MRKAFTIYLLVCVQGICGIILAQDTIRFSYDESGNRIARVITLNKSSRIGTQVSVSEKTAMEFTDNSLTDRVVKTYPNPTGGLLDVEVTDNNLDNSSIHLIILDINGRKIIEKRAEPLKSSLDLSGYPNGIYFLLLKEGTKVSKWKIIKQ